MQPDSEDERLESDEEEIERALEYYIEMKRIEALEEEPKDSTEDQKQAAGGWRD